MATIERIKIYGERNTGTNFLHALITKNFATPVISQKAMRTSALRQARKLVADKIERGDRRIMRRVVLNRLNELEIKNHTRVALGWKHMRVSREVVEAVPDKGARTLFLVIVKHPGFWALSFNRRPYHDYFNRPDAPFSKFLRRIFVPFALDNVDALTYPCAIDLYAEKIDGYRELAGMGVPFELVRYEDLLGNIPSFLDKLETRHGLTRKSETAVVPQKSTKKDDRDLEQFQASYTLDRLKTLVSQEDYAFIMSKFGSERLAWLGYPPD